MNLDGTYLLVHPETGDIWDGSLADPFFKPWGPGNFSFWSSSRAATAALIRYMVAGEHEHGPVRMYGPSYLDMVYCTPDGDMAKLPFPESVLPCVARLVQFRRVMDMDARECVHVADYILAPAFSERSWEKWKYALYVRGDGTGKTEKSLRELGITAKVVSIRARDRWSDYTKDTVLLSSDRDAITAKMLLPSIIWAYDFEAGRQV